MGNQSIIRDCLDDSKKGGSTNSGHFEVYAEERKEREKDKGRLSIKGEGEDRKPKRVVIVVVTLLASLGHPRVAFGTDGFHLTNRRSIPLGASFPFRE